MLFPLRLCGGRSGLAAQVFSVISLEDDAGLAAVVCVAVWMARTGTKGKLFTYAHLTFSKKWLAIKAFLYRFLD